MSHFIILTVTPRPKYTPMIWTGPGTAHYRTGTEIRKIGFGPGPQLESGADPNNRLRSGVSFLATINKSFNRGIIQTAILNHWLFVQDQIREERSWNRSRISWWRWITSPPLLQSRASVVVKGAPHHYTWEVTVTMWEVTVTMFWSTSNRVHSSTLQKID